LKGLRVKRARDGDLLSQTFEAAVVGATAMQDNAAEEVIRPRAAREEV